VFFILIGSQMVLLHGFIKKTQKTPEKELKLATPE
jgi:phage-related protein